MEEYTEKTLNCEIVEQSLVDAMILVSVNELGSIDCIEYCNYNLQSKLKAEKWKKEKLAQGLHSFTYIKIKLPYPENYAIEGNKV